MSIKSPKNNGYSTRRPVYTYDNISLILLKIRNVVDKSCRKNQNTHFMFNNLFPKIVPFMR